MKKARFEGRGRIVSGKPKIALLVSCLGFLALGVTLMHALPPVLTLAFFLALLGTMTASVLAQLGGLSRKRSIVCDERGLVADGKVVLPAAEILRGYRRRDDTTDVDVSRRKWFQPSWRIKLTSVADAKRLAEALDFERELAVAHYRALPPWAHRMRVLYLILGVLPSTVGLWWRHLPPAGWAFLLLFLALAAIPFLVPQHLEVGEDGISFRGARKRFVPFRSVRLVVATALGAELELADGEKIEVRFANKEETARDPRDAFVRRVKRGIAAAGTVTRADLEAMLARGGRETAAWIADMHALGRGYRDAAVPRELLWQVLESPTADPSAREGAAIALYGTLDEAARTRMREIAQRSASPRLRVAVDAVTNARDEAHVRVAYEEAEDEAVTTNAQRRRRA